MHEPTRSMVARAVRVEKRENNQVLHGPGDHATDAALMACVSAGRAQFVQPLLKEPAFRLLFCTGERSLE